MEYLLNLFSNAQQALFEALVQPLIFAMGLTNFLEDGYTATGWLLVLEYPNSPKTMPPERTPVMASTSPTSHFQY